MSELTRFFAKEDYIQYVQYSRRRVSVDVTQVQYKELFVFSETPKLVVLAPIFYFTTRSFVQKYNYGGWPTAAGRTPTLQTAKNKAVTSLRFSGSAHQSIGLLVNHSTALFSTLFYL